MEESYLFNPFVTKCSNEEIAKEYRRLQNMVLDECNSPREYAHNIEVYADMNYLLGEMIARYNYEYILLKNTIKIEESMFLQKSRDEWLETHTGKAPAISYFEALATAQVQDKLKQLARCESNLRRFKNAYESIQEKANAIKKQLEALKYETV